MKYTELTEISYLSSVRRTYHLYSPLFSRAIYWSANSEVVAPTRGSPPLALRAISVSPPSLGPFSLALSAIHQFIRYP